MISQPERNHNLTVYFSTLYSFFYHSLVILHSREIQVFFPLVHTTIGDPSFCNVETRNFLVVELRGYLYKCITKMRTGNKNILNLFLIQIKLCTFNKGNILDSKMASGMYILDSKMASRLKSVDCLLMLKYYLNTSQI